ncbi:MAG: tetratricopeptide repeat protein [Limisphaerales bacterium]
MIGFFRNLFGGGNEPPQHKPPVRLPPEPRRQPEKNKQEPFLPGSQLLGKYEIIRKLGEGGFGVVLLARGQPTEPLVALKVVRSDLEFAADVIQRFKKEAGIWINMDVHPNIVQAHFFLASGGQMVIGIDYVEPDANGCVTLADHIRRGIELKQLVILATDVCKGMSHAFSKGLKAHRDLKPTNILIADADYFRPYLPTWRPTLARVSDFGLSGQVVPQSAADRTPTARKTDATVAGEISGTPAYMAPEQFDGLIHCSERSDIYSFGLILYEGVSGRAPVQQNPRCRNGREIWADFARQHREKHFPKLDSLLWPVIAKCTSKNPRDRFGSFSEIGHVLENCLTDHFGIVLPLELTYERDAHGLSNKAVSLSKLGDHAAALENISRALEMEPNNPNFLMNKASILYGAKRLKEAIETCRTALELNPNHGGCWIILGRCLELAGQIPEAISAQRKGLDLDPPNDVGWSNLGRLLLETSQFEEAERCCSKAIELAPTIAAYHSDLGRALLKRERVEQARACFNKALELDATDSTAHKCLGDICFLFDNNLQGAEKHYRNAVGSNPEDFWAWDSLGSLLASVGRHDEALNCFREAVKHNSNHFYSWKHMGRLHAEALRFAEAADSYRKCTMIQSNEPDGWFGLGNALEKLGNHEGALAAFEEALKYDPAHYDSWLRIADLHMVASRPIEAIKCFRKCTSLNPKGESGWEGLAASLLFSGAEPRETMEALFRVLSINMRNFSAWCYLGQMCVRMGWHADAHEAFLMVLTTSDPHDTASEGAAAYAANREAAQYAVSQISKLPKHPGKTLLDWDSYSFIKSPPQK